MALKSATGKMFTLFHACLPENEEVEKQLLLQEIYEMKEYRELSLNKKAAVLMNGIYSKNSLAEQSVVVLRNIKDAIAYADNAVEAIILCKKYGNVKDVISLGLPDFTSRKSLEGIIDLSHSLGETENLTNISDDDLFGIYNENTETEMHDIADAFSIDDLQNNLSKKLPKLMKDKKYWISASDFTDVQNEYFEQLNLLKEEKKNLGKAKNKIRLVKVYISICYLVLAACLGTTLDSSAASVFIGSTGLAWILYLIKG